ncbi:MerR family transcriptional regulator [Paenibacillus sp. N1-5-1-14]|uniref:MerR family transcriptional regulator n=1 Tax=Paenibacillus radicibacter TaxID=2972488 RepID=UPI00215932E5|nr:MerR family transcriptional regulator [Paenibacillus radicibacter]MCR8641764.1 MerR family transcriptional regulator [Paenibacillus radicibacter]
MTTTKKYYSIGEFAKQTGTPIRTLHYYDEIGLLQPVKNPSSGHRLYTDEDALTLQQIVTFKFLGYSLNEISGMLSSSSFDVSLLESLQIQQKALEDKEEHIRNTLKSINRTILLLEEEKEIDSAILMSLIKTMQMEREERQWFEEHTSERLAEVLFDQYSEEQLAQSDKDYVRHIAKVKEVAGMPVESAIVQQFIAKWLQAVNDHLVSTMKLMDEELQQQIENLEPEEYQLPPSPFTPEEEEWLDAAMEYYFEHTTESEE